MKIIITGCVGFITSHIIEILLKDTNNNIIGIDNLYSGTEDNLNYLQNIDEIINKLSIKKFKLFNDGIMQI